MGKATGPTYRVSFKRRRKRITNYAKRLALIKSELPRMVIRGSNKNVIVQFIKYESKGDKVIAFAKSCELSPMGWYSTRNTPTAYLTGLLAAKRAKLKGVSNFVLDIGMVRSNKGSISFAGMKGAVDAGLETNFDESIIVPDRINGKHIADYALSMRDNNKDSYNKRFAGYIKAKVQPEKLPELFEKTKKLILN